MKNQNKICHSKIVLAEKIKSQDIYQDIFSFLMDKSQKELFFNMNILDVDKVDNENKIISKVLEKFHSQMNDNFKQLDNLSKENESQQKLIFDSLLRTIQKAKTFKDKLIISLEKSESDTFLINEGLVKLKINID